MITILLETIINMLQGWIDSFNSHAQHMEDKIDSIDSTASDIKTDTDNLPDIKDNTAAIITPIQSIKSNTDSISTSSSTTASNTTAILNNIGTISTNTGSAAAYAEDCANNTLNILDKVTTIASDTTQIRANTNAIQTISDTLQYYFITNIVTEESEGAIANFNTDLEDYLQKLVINIPSDVNGINSLNLYQMGGNFFNKNNVTNGLLINGAGNEVSYADWNLSDYIPVIEGVGYYLYGIATHPNTNQDNLELFDSSKTKIGFANVKTNEQPYVIPAGVAYVKCCVKNADLNTAQFGVALNASYCEYNPIINNIPLSFTTIYDGASLDLLSGIIKINTSPITFDSITPISIRTIKGFNNIFVDNGTTSIIYRETMKNYLDKMNPNTRSISDNRNLNRIIETDENNDMRRSE